MSDLIDEMHVRRIARLARLNLTDAEARQFAGELAAIVDYVGQLAAVNTDSVESHAHPLSLREVIRADEPRAGLTSQAALSNAPQRIDDLFRVPAVLDSGRGA